MFYANSLTCFRLNNVELCKFNTHASHEEIMLRILTVPTYLFFILGVLALLQFYPNFKNSVYPAAASGVWGPPSSAVMFRRGVKRQSTNYTFTQPDKEQQPDVAHRGRGGRGVKHQRIDQSLIYRRMEQSLQAVGSDEPKVGFCSLWHVGLHILCLFRCCL